VKTGIALVSSSIGSYDDMVLRYLRERKKLVLCVVCVYLALCYLAYRRLRSGGIRIATDTLSIWNRDLQLLSRSVIGVDGPLGPTAKAVVTVAIGSGITSRKLRDVSARNVAAKFQFFHVFLPSFCRTASAHFDYRFYLGYDRSDQVLSRQRIRDAFQGEFKAATTSGQCRDREITVSSLTLLECDYAGKPAWAQNDAMLEAYLDHVDYLYRINDDTRLLTAGWTEKFISKLEKYTTRFLNPTFGHILIFSCVIFWRGELAIFPTLVVNYKIIICCVTM